MQDGAYSGDRGLILYGCPGWGSTITEAMLDLCGVPFQLVDESGFDGPGPARERLLQVNPLGQVPALVLDDGTVMTETAAIALFLDRLHPEAGLSPHGGDPSAQAHFLRWLIWIVANIYPTFTLGDYPERWVPTDSAPALAEAFEERRMELWRQIEAVAEAPWFMGEGPCAIDIYVAVMVHYRPRRAWFEENCPRLSAIASAADGHPILGAALKRNFPAEV